MSEIEIKGTPNVQVDKIGERMQLKANVESVSLNLNIEQLLELQDKYTTLQNDCLRLFNHIHNLSKGYPSDMLTSGNQTINWIAELVRNNFMPIKK